MAYGTSSGMFRVYSFQFSFAISQLIVKFIWKVRATRSGCTGNISLGIWTELHTGNKI